MEEAIRAHIRHCFDYIRQSIQCSADMIISWENLTEPERLHIDGWDIPHRQCRDWVLRMKKKKKKMLTVD